MADVSNLGPNLAARKSITYDTCGATANYPNKVGENLATDNDDTTYYFTGYSNASFKTIQPG